MFSCVAWWQLRKYALCDLTHHCDSQYERISLWNTVFMSLYGMKQSVEENNGSKMNKQITVHLCYWHAKLLWNETKHFPRKRVYITLPPAHQFPLLTAAKERQWTIHLLCCPHNVNRHTNVVATDLIKENYLELGLVYLFTHSVAYVTLDTSITDYNLQHNL